MKIHRTMAFVLLLLLPALFAGCGSDSGQTTALAASQPCIGCHASNTVSISPVTGERITDEWSRSTHNTANGAGCHDCHTTVHFHKNLADCLACHSSHIHPDSCGQCHGGSTKITNCRDCHAAVHTNPDSCQDCHEATGEVKAELVNPDIAGKCLDCHRTLGPPHFSNNITGISHDAQFVDLQNVGKCRNCHNPHDTTILPAATAWATSGHGDVKAKPWSEEDLKANTSCLRCHTATGYVNYVTSTPAFTLPTTPLAASPTYGVLGCNACHKNYNFTNHTSVRKIAAYTAPYNGNNNPQLFPNVGDSNLCIPCHSGRENNDSINSVADFTNASFKNSHYMAAAGLMYMKTGFINFTSLSTFVPTINSSGVINPTGTTYGKTLQPNSTGAGAVPGGVVGGNTSKHRRLGTADIVYNGVPAETWIPAVGVYDKGGPCVTCHIKANIENMPAPDLGTLVSGVYQGNGPYYDTSTYGPIPATRAGAGHSLKIDPDAARQTCIPCHGDEASVGNPADGVEKKNEEARPGYLAALGVIKTLLETKYNIRYDETRHPYFYDLAIDPVGNTQVKDWTRGTRNQAFGKKMMGACFNLNLLNRDRGAYVHARNFTQRLLFDTVDFLDDGMMNLSSKSTYTAIDPVNFANPDNTPANATQQLRWVIGTSGNYFKLRP